MKKNGKKRLRLTALLLVVFCVASMLTACAGDTPKGDGSDVPPSPPDPISIVADGASEYAIVYSSTDAGGRNAARALQATLLERTGAELILQDDRTAPVEGVPEILVGKTNRGTAHGFQRSLRAGEWLIYRDAENVYLLGDSETLLKRACEYFVSFVMDVDFKVNEYGEIYRVSGRYNAESVKLNGLPITDYTFLYEKGGSTDWKDILDWVSERLSLVSGYALTTAEYVSDASVSGVAVILREDTSLGQTGYRIEAQGQSIAITVGSHATALALFAGVIEEQLPANAKGAVELSASSKVGYMGESATVSLTEGADIRVMTYNVLGNVKEATDYINATVVAYLPDFLCTQEYYNEADKAVTTYLAEAGYGKIGGKFTCASPTAVELNDEQYTKVGSTCNTPIFYRTDLWEVVESEAYLFYWQNRWPYTDTKSMTYGVFRNKNDGELVMVVGTHYALMASGYTEYADLGYTDAKEGAAWRYQDTLEILKAVDEIRAKYPGILTIVGGDLNANVNEKALITMEDHAILSNAYTMAPSGNRTDGGTYHNAHGKKPSGAAIDHIFVSEDVADVVLHAILKEQYVLEGSDHCPVIADISRK